MDVTTIMLSESSLTIMGENGDTRDLVDFDVTMSTSREKYSGRWCGLTSTNSAVHVNVKELIQKTLPKRSQEESFQTCCMDWGKVNPFHAYYNGSCTSKDNEDPSWSTSFKTRRTKKTSSALEVLWKTLFVFCLYMIGTLCVGCGEPLYGHPCQWCTCERCGNVGEMDNDFIAIQGMGSFTYDSTPNSFDNSPDFSYHPPQPQYETYSCELCGNDAHYGYDCPPQFPVIHQPSQEMSIQDMEDLKQQYLDEMKTLINKKDYRNGKIDIEIKINELKGNFNGMSIEINKKKKLQQLEQVANLNTYPSRNFNSFCYYDDDDDDEEYTIAITPDLPTEEPDNSLSMGDEHLDTILQTQIGNE
ncbi:hypothetical protein Tco_0771935 [Tanacetum coccineum]|uniref:CCHC-type domain-containing protein n=1 Tax=Tanacetum coccineum TaxID=301880 RepID=A0ABQ4ZGI3_9ASTR